MAQLSLSRHLSAILAVVVVLSAGGLLSAQMGADDDRVIPYSGTLESDGVAANGLHDFRFALFTVAPDDVALDCLLADPPSCPLWSETQESVGVNGGAFSVTLGETTAITDSMLGQDALYIGVAVRAEGDTAYSKLGGSSRVLPTPWASRTAAQRNFSVIDDLDVGGDITATSIRANGNVSVAGRIRADCPAGMIRIVGNSAVCIDTGLFDVGTRNWYDSATACYNEGKRLCSAAEANVAIRANPSLQIDFNVLDRWIWVDAVNEVVGGGQDFFGCHANLNVNQPGTFAGEMNCQLGASLNNFVIGRKCCFDQ